SWHALSILKMEILKPPGYPIYSLLAKLFTLIPVGDLAYKINLFSAILGAFTILLLFSTIYILVKDEIISLVSSLTLAFIIPFWSISNRIGTDSINICFIILAIYSAVRYSEQLNRKNLYLFFFCFGLSLVNNQVNYYSMPVFFIYIVLLNPIIFKNVKVIILCILFFILPLLSYSYYFFRPLQGYDNTNIFINFIYYIFGHLPDGSIYIGSLQHLPAKTIDVDFPFFLAYIQPFYNNFGLFLSIISFAGFVYLLKKNIKFAIFSFLYITVTFYIIIQYLDGLIINYLLPVYAILCIYSSFFFLLAKDIVLLLIKKFLKNKKTQNYAYHVPITIILLLLLIQPIILASINYKYSDNSKLDEAYIAWNKIFNNIEDDSYLFVFSKVSNIGIYINLYEQKEKRVKFISSEDKDYSLDLITDVFNEGKKVYIIGNEKSINEKLNFENTGLSFELKRHEKFLSVKKVTSEKITLELSYDIISMPKKVGDTFSLELIVINNRSERVQISSLELKLPQNIEFISVDRKGYFAQDPGYSQAKYMWVKDSY
ncbi:MAG: DUF2723 domain-containing protein, partial [Actinobacteria bacterium]|nr:DUF2723 domain-containing protein [Actinomycetota bacterium]